MKSRRFIKSHKVTESDQNREDLDDVNPQKENLFTGDFLLDTNHIKQLYSFPTNIDFIIREFRISNTRKKAALFFIPSLTDTKIIEEEIIKPLMMSEHVNLDLSSSISASAVNKEKKISEAIR